MKRLSISSLGVHSESLKLPTTKYFWHLGSFLPLAKSISPQCNPFNPDSHANHLTFHRPLFSQKNHQSRDDLGSFHSDSSSDEADDQETRGVETSASHSHGTLSGVCSQCAEILEEHENVRLQIDEETRRLNQSRAVLSQRTVNEAADGIFPKTLLSFPIGGTEQRLNSLSSLAGVAAEIGTKHPARPDSSPSSDGRGSEPVKLGGSSLSAENHRSEFACKFVRWNETKRNAGGCRQKPHRDFEGKRRKGEFPSVCSTSCQWIDRIDAE